MNWMYKEDFLAHYGVKGMKWHHRKKKAIEFDNSSDAYQYDKNNNWFKNVTAKTKFPGRSRTTTISTYPGMHLVSDNEEKERKQEHITVLKRETIIDQGKRIIDDILKNIGDFATNLFNKKK